MDALLTPAVLGPVGGALLIIFFPYIQIARGKLVPRSALDDQIAEKEIWRIACGDKDKVIAAQSGQITELMETTRVSRATMEALHRAATS